MAAFVTVLFWSIGVFPFTEASRRLGPQSVNHFRLFLAVILLTIILLGFYPVALKDMLTSPSSESWIWLGLSGVIGLAVGDYFGFTSFAILGTRVASIFTTLAPAAALFTGFFLLDETVNFVGIAGMVITISGVLWLTLSKAENEPHKDLGFGSLNKGIFFAILAALCQGAGLVLAKKGMNGNGLNALIPVHAAWMRMVSAMLILYVYSLLRGNLMTLHSPIRNNTNNGLYYLLGGTMFGPVLGVACSMIAVSMINVSVAQTIFSLLPVFVLPLAYLFYKEKITFKITLAALVAVSGVIILIWRNEAEMAITRLVGH